MQFISIMRTAVIALACAVAIGAHAQPFPAKPIRLIVSFPPGGAVALLIGNIALPAHAV